MLPVSLLAALATIVAIVVLVVRRRRPAPAPVAAPAPPKVLAAAVAPAPRISGPVSPRPRSDPANPLDALDALLAELESSTVLIDSSDELDERAVAELEGLAARLEVAAARFAAR